jgi:hypothetical protein
LAPAIINHISFAAAISFASARTFIAANSITTAISRKMA